MGSVFAESTLFYVGICNIRVVHKMFLKFWLLFILFDILHVLKMSVKTLKII